MAGLNGFVPGAVKETVALESVRYDVHTGLVPVVVQDVRTGNLLMLAYANREALKRTLGTGEAWFWSRSRQAYWRKGATSGNVQHVVDVRIDCDGDTVLYLVEPAGPACHTGEETCFYRNIAPMQSARVTEDSGVPDDARAAAGPGPALASAAAADAQQSTAADRTADRADEATDRADDAMDRAHDARLAANGASGAAPLGAGDAAEDSVLRELWAVIEDRWRRRPQGSYTTYLFEQGVDKAGKKVGEESVEVVIAAKNAVERPETGRAELASESADLLYHLLVLWRSAGVRPQDVYEVLRSRFE